MKAVGSVLKTNPKTILNDYARLIDMAGYKDFISGDMEFTSPKRTSEQRWARPNPETKMFIKIALAAASRALPPLGDLFDRVKRDRHSFVGLRVTHSARSRSRQGPTGRSSGYAGCFPRSARGPAVDQAVAPEP